LAGSLYDVYLFRKESAQEDDMTEKYGGLEIGLFEALRKHLGFIYHVSIKHTPVLEANLNVH